MVRAKVLVMPGSLCFGNGKEFKGYVRIGFCCATDVLRAVLDVLAEYMRLNWSLGGVRDVE